MRGYWHSSLHSNCNDYNLKFLKIVIKLLYSNNPDVHWTRYVHLYILLKQSNTYTTLISHMNTCTMIRIVWSATLLMMWLHLWLLFNCDKYSSEFFKIVIKLLVNNNMVIILMYTGPGMHTYKFYWNSPTHTVLFRLVVCNEYSRDRISQWYCHGIDMTTLIGYFIHMSTWF